MVRELTTTFYCQACLDDKPATEASPDPRYCQACYDVLIKEAVMLSSARRPKWAPRTPQKPIAEAVKQAPGVGHNYIDTPVGSEIMSTVKANKKRGPKHLALPEELIRQLAGEGMGSKAIATRLKAEHRVVISYKTIQRVLSGERAIADLV